MNRQKNPAISTHLTLNSPLQVNWGKEYQGEFSCPHCIRGKFKHFVGRANAYCHLVLRCKNCHKYTYLTCRVGGHIFSYVRDEVCPNPLCTKLGPNGQKGWIYKDNKKRGDCKCHFCGIKFNPASDSYNSWVGNQREDKLIPFCFEKDTWDLRHFFEQPSERVLYFQNVQPHWYRLPVKKYTYYLLKSRAYATSGTIKRKLITLRQFGQFLEQKGFQDFTDITREASLFFIDCCKALKPGTLHNKLTRLKEFFEWLDLEAGNLIRHRDFPKRSINDADWLDDVARTAIKGHLAKIPAPIARHYLIQEFTASRPGDVCQMAFDCLVEEKGQWYVRFFQQKVARWHTIPATREIRVVIEEQQQWIREVLGADYPYLFCHFRVIKEYSYPDFPNIKPLLVPPKTNASNNPMVRIIRLLIERENVTDANGCQPHFTGKITRSTRLQEIRVKHGMEAARLYADHVSSTTTFQHYAPPTREQVAEADLPFQELLLNPDNRFLPWQSLPESLLRNPVAHELDLELSPRLVVYGHCALDPKTPCPVNLFPKCYGCSSFRPSTGKLPLYERQYQGEQQRLTEAEKVGAELASEEAKATIEAMDKWLPDLRRLANG